MLRFGLVLAVVLAVFWLALSGYLHDPLILSFGVISVLLVIALCMRMKIMDEETVPYLSALFCLARQRNRQSQCASGQSGFKP